MLSSADLERLITVKRHEIEKEKTALGLSLPPDDSHNTLLQENGVASTCRKQLKISESEVHRDHHDSKQQAKKAGDSESLQELEPIPAGLDRYIRRYIGLPVMLKAGEYSPNNPLLRGERSSGDALVGLGEYERRRNTFRKLRQQQYREYLDQQAKKKQDEKERAERLRRERELQDIQQEEDRERERANLDELHNEQQQQRFESAEQRRASVCYVPIENTNISHKNTVDTGVQVGISRPLSVAVQTDGAELYRPSPSPTKCQLTQAERELSPRTVVEPCERAIQPAPRAARWERGRHSAERRRSYGDFDERSSTIRKSNRDKLVSDLRHTYMPSIFDADAIEMRNIQAEKEAAERRQYYQQELKNQIQEQQRIREERKSREKMLEQAEMRRLEEQLRMLRMAQEREVNKQRDVTNEMKQNATDYANKRTNLQMEIDLEHQNLLRATCLPKRTTTTSHSDTNPSNLPFYYPRGQNKPPYSTNIPNNSIFSKNYDVDSYLRKNLNPSVESLKSRLRSDTYKENVVEAIVHEPPKKRYAPSFRVDRKNDTPIPVLKHSVKCRNDDEDDKISDAMRLVVEKWKVPAVQKDLLKSLPNDEGRNVSILTQLGSIRRQLQLEQLKLDGVTKGDA